MNRGDPVWITVDRVRWRAEVFLASSNRKSLCVEFNNGLPGMALLGDPETGRYEELLTGRIVEVAFHDPERSDRKNPC